MDDRACSKSLEHEGRSDCWTLSVQHCGAHPCDIMSLLFVKLEVQIQHADAGLVVVIGQDHLISSFETDCVSPVHHWGMLSILPHSSRSLCEPASMSIAFAVPPYDCVDLARVSELVVLCGKCCLLYTSPSPRD